MSRQPLITFQPSEFTDYITEDGTELTKLPYPVHAWANDGQVPRDLGGWTDATRIIGFQADPAIQRVDLTWAAYRRGDPQAAVGLYVVAETRQGGITGLTTAVRDVEVRDFDRPDTIDPLTATPDGQRRWEGWA